MTGDAHSGIMAARVTIPPGQTSATVRVQSRMDLGGCSPVAVPGASYSASIWHKGDAEATLQVLYVNSDGLLVSMRKDAALPHSADWQLDTVISPSMPSNARFLVVRVEVSSSGSIELDDASTAAVP